MEDCAGLVAAAELDCVRSIINLPTNVVSAV
jgi:hypothetical protein